MKSFVAAALASVAVFADDAWVTSPYFDYVDYQNTAQGLVW